MYCTKCGNKTQEQERYCTHCGNPISKDIRLDDSSISEDKELDQDECIEIKDTGINNRPDELTPPPIPNQIDSTTEILVAEENINTIDNTEMWRAPFSFDGRIRRTEYCISLIVWAFSLIFTNVLVKHDFFIFVLMYIPIYWFKLAQGAKRCHDRGNSGWYQIIPLYPIILCFLDSDLGDNKYGNNPKGIK
jgi:uncharacterized membrane protein YhaH (DUF805 family)